MIDLEFEYVSKTRRNPNEFLLGLPQIHSYSFDIKLAISDVLKLYKELNCLVSIRFSRN